MNFQQNIQALFTLLEANLISQNEFKTLALKTSQQIYERIHEYTHQIENFGFICTETLNGIMVDAYQNGERIHSRLINDNTNEVRIYNYCNKFATNTSYRNMRIREFMSH